MKKFIVVSFFLLTSILLTFTGCYKDWFGNRPLDQPASYWISEDGSVVFKTDDNGQGRGFLKYKEEVIDIVFLTGDGENILIHLGHNFHELLINDEHTGIFAPTGEIIEKWQGDFKDPHYFTATIMETTYFEIDQKILFFRVTEDVYNSVLETNLKIDPEKQDEYFIISGYVNQ